MLTDRTGSIQPSNAVVGLMRDSSPLTPTAQCPHTKPATKKPALVSDSGSHWTCGPMKISPEDAERIARGPSQDPHLSGGGRFSETHSIPIDLSLIHI